MRLRYNYLPILFSLLWVSGSYVQFLSLLLSLCVCLSVRTKPEQRYHHHWAGNRVSRDSPSGRLGGRLGLCNVFLDIPFTSSRRRSISHVEYGCFFFFFCWALTRLVGGLYGTVEGGAQVYLPIYCVLGVFEPRCFFWSRCWIAHTQLYDSTSSNNNN